jgi:signal transduction histidine kinase
LNLSAGGIFLIDHEKPSFSLRVQQGLTESVGDKTGQILFRDKPLMQSLLKKDLSLKPEPIFPPFKAILKDGVNKNPPELTCFLITAKEKASGFLAFEVPANRNLTTGQDYNLLGSLGNFLGGAIENALLHQTIQKHREELKGLTARLFHSQEDERKRIARELHDEAGQALTGLNFTLETIEKKLSSENPLIKGLINDAREQIHRTHQEMRRISYRLHPALLSDLGLEPALESYLSTISKHSMLNVDFRMVGFEGRVDQETEIVLYRLSQEALTNTLKHSRAKHFKLSIIKGYPQIIFLAEDDGIGFDSGEFDKPKHALGLLSMRERAAMLGGNFSLRTSPGKGTRIRIEIPIKDSSHD